MKALRLPLSFLLSLVCCCFSSKAQPSDLVLSGSEKRFEQLLKEVDVYTQERRYDSCLHRLLAAKQLLPKVKRPDLQADYFLQYGKYYHNGLQRFDSALVYYYLGLPYADQVPNWTKRLELVERIAYSHYTNTEPELALKWCTRCIELSESLNNVDYQARCMQLLGTLSVSYNQDTTQLIAYRRRALDLCLQSGELKSLPRAYHYMALAFHQIGKYQMALNYNDSCLHWAAQFNDERYQAEARFWQGLSFKELQQFPAALDKLNSVMPYFEKCRDTFRIIHTQHAIGQLLLAEHKYLEALALLRKLELMVQRKNALYEWSLHYEIYYNAYRKIGNFQMALDYFERYEAVKDSMIQKANVHAVAEVEARYLVRDKQKKIESQQSELLLGKRLEWFYILCILLALAAATTFLLLYFKIRKARREAAEQRDIVERQKKELEQLDELKSRFFANVSHELRTPLTLMLGPVSSMINSGELSETNTKLAHLAQQHGKQLLGLVHEILELSKIESGKLSVQEISVSLQPFLMQIAGGFQSYAQEQGINLFVDYQAPKRLQLLLDADKLSTILNNLLSNALKFTPAHTGGQIVLSALDLGDRIQLSVTDNGRGIHPDDLPYIFDRFYQSKQTNVPVEGGTGIGLALCREYSILLEGELYAESPARGKNCGVAFHFILPRKEDLQYPNKSKPKPKNIATGAGLAPQPSDNAIGAAGGPVVLVVEDNPGMRDYLCSILSKNYVVQTAENGQMALQLLHAAAGSQPNKEKPNDRTNNQQLPDLIVSDLMMPVMDGFQLLKVLKGTANFRHIPIIMLTARADIQDKLEALRIGVDDYLLKPFEEQELLARISNLLRFAQQRQFKSSAARAPNDAAQLSDSDATWLEALEKLALQYLSDSQFSLAFLASQMRLSARQMQRRLKDATGLSANQYITEIRLQRGRQLLESGEFLIKQAAAEVGFKDANYFSTLLKERFGKLDVE